MQPLRMSRRVMNLAHKLTHNARRFGVALERYPTIESIDAMCRKLEAFARAAPEAQADAPVAA